MMGLQKEQKELFSYQIDLDRRVRPENPLRKIRDLVDFTFARGEVKDNYGYNGNESVDPAVIMKMMFLLFYNDVASERELMRTIPERLDYMWFLGYGLDDDVPNHSVLSKARRRWGVEVFESLFVRIVEQCVSEGLVGGEKIHVDASLVDANTSKNSVIKGSPELIEALKEVYKSEARKLDEPEEEKRKKYYDPKNRGMMSKTDPDAPIVRQTPKESRPRYKAHRVVDDVHGVITATETTPGDVEENAQLLEMVERHEGNTDRAVKTVVADRQYGTAENFRACYERGIRSHMGDMQSPQLNKGCREGIFGQDNFVYDAQTDTYMCPAGQKMTRRKHKKTRLAYEYSCSMSICRVCKIRSKCTRARDGAARTLKRHYKQEAIDAGRAESHTRAAKRDRLRRKWLVEGSFADAANNHGFKRSRWRRLWRQQIQDYMIAAVQNVRILIRYLKQNEKAIAMSATRNFSDFFCSLNGSIGRLRGLIWAT